MRKLTITFCLLICTVSALHAAAPAAVLAEQKALLESLEIKPGQLMPLLLDTVLVADGKPQAVICHADAPAWREAAVTIQQAIAQSTGVTLPLCTDRQLETAQADGQNVILLGHLDNNRHVARLYHNFFVCLDQGSAGRTGYEIRSVHDPFGTKHNSLLVGGSTAEGTRLAAERFAAIVKEQGKPGALKLGRLCELKFDPEDKASPIKPALTESAAQAAIEGTQKLFRSAGQGRGAVSGVINAGIAFHHTGDPLQGKIYHAGMAQLLDYYRTDKTINQDGMARYDNDFRDAWTWQIAVLWDLLEESGLFTDQERLDYTNLVIRLALECELYQGWDRPDTLKRWAANTDIVHNHNTFPGLGGLFAGNYCLRHYGLKRAENWLTVARGMFNGQKRSHKPLEDAASYQWLPIIHTMIYSLAENDLTFFEENHARLAAKVGLMVMDATGAEAAFGDHDSERGGYAAVPMLQVAGWYYGDAGLLYSARIATGGATFGPMGQEYNSAVKPAPPADHVGLTLSFLPRQSYDYISHSPQYPTPPNLPFERTFDKLSLRSGWDRNDEFFLLDGMGRGTHMHFDNNALIRFSKGGEPLLVDGEYIKNAPKYHSSLVIIRDGQSELTPPVTGLLAADDLDTAAYTRTLINDYNGADWTRSLLWRKNGYLLVSDEVRALKSGNYTLRCCWRPWGEVSVEGAVASVQHPPMRLTVASASGLPWRLETLKAVERMPVSRLSQQVSVQPEPGQSFQFVTLVAADGAEKKSQFRIRRVADGLAVVDSPAGIDVVALARRGIGLGELPGLTIAAKAAMLCPDRLILARCSKLAGRQTLLEADGEVSAEITPAAGTAAISAPAAATVTLRVAPNAKVTGEGVSATADAAGLVTLKLAPGLHRLSFERFPMYPEILTAAQTVAALPALPDEKAGAAASLPQLPLRWQFSNFTLAPQTVKVVSATASVPSKAPIMRLFDGEYRGSTNSTAFPEGKPVTVTAELQQETELQSILLREWHMNPAWDIGERRVEISSDGFVKDVRALPGPLVDVGREAFGGNVNTLMELKIGQRAKQVRVTLTPARPDSYVYLAEIELHGTLPGTRPDLRACAAGDMDGDGTPETLTGTSSGQIQALDASGKPRWSYQSKLRGPINDLACCDVTGDGRAETIYGANAARLGLISSEGRLLWEIELPPFRGIMSDVKTVFPADVNGDGKAEIVCGCASWQYFAVDVTGQRLWGNIIYAHSATVGMAADLDADGRQEVIAGDEYYTLNVIDHDGRRLWCSASIGPGMTAVAAISVDADPQPEVLAGVDGGNLHCYDGDGKVLWQVNLGDKVTRLLPLDVDGDGREEIIASAESAHLFALKTDGSILWRSALPGGVSDVVVTTDGRLLCAAGEAGVLEVNRDGSLRRAGLGGTRVERLLRSGEGLVAMTADGRVVGLGL